MSALIKRQVMQKSFTKLGKRIESQVRKALYDFDLVGDGSITVALSGGKDSITLLKMLKAISGRGFIPFKLHAVHVGGEFSCGAGIHEGYLKNICDNLEVPFTIRYSDQKLESLECYSCSRERRAMIFEEAKKAGSKIVAFGHHRDDNAQTILMNLLHKGEFAGNLPKLEMVDYGVTIIRPLIFVSENEIREFAKLEGFLRTMCQCPVGQDSLRKKTDQILSDLEKIYPNVRENVARASLLYGSDKARK